MFVSRHLTTTTPTCRIINQPTNQPQSIIKLVDCRGICNEPASDKIFRLRLPNVDDALAGKWPKYWNFAGKDQWETMGAP